MKSMCFIRNLADAFFLYIFLYIRKYTIYLRLSFGDSVILRSFVVSYLSTKNLLLTSIFLLMKQPFQCFS